MPNLGLLRHFEFWSRGVLRVGRLCIRNYSRKFNGQFLGTDSWGFRRIACLYNSLRNFWIFCFLLKNSKMDHSYTNFGIYFTARDVFCPNFWLSMESGSGVIRRFQWNDKHTIFSDWNFRIRRILILLLLPSNCFSFIF